MPTRTTDRAATMTRVHNHQPRHVIALQVIARFDTASRQLTVHWHTPQDASTFAHTRLFLVESDLPEPTYLGIADTGREAAFTLTDPVAPGPCRVVVETYSSASWGGGHLTGSGSSGVFAVD